LPQARRPLAQPESSNGNTLKLRTSSGLIRRRANKALLLSWSEPPWRDSLQTRHRVATPRQCLLRSCRAWASRETGASCAIVGCLRHCADFIYPQVSDVGKHALRLLVAESSRRSAIAKCGGGLLCSGKASASGRAPQEETGLDVCDRIVQREVCKGIPGGKGVPVFVLLKCPINRLVSTCCHLEPASGWCSSVTIDSANWRKQ